MDGEYVGKLHVQRRLRARVEIVELVDIELLFGGSDIDYYRRQRSKSRYDSEMNLQLDQISSIRIKASEMYGLIGCK